MAQLAISLAGAAAGNFILPGIGGQIGFALGSVIGGYLTQPKPPTLYGPKIEDGAVTSSAYGGMIPKICGTVSVHGNIIDNGPLVTEAIEEDVGGGKGAPTQKSVTYTQYMDYDVAICDSADAIVQIYMNEKLYYDASPNATIQQPAWLQFTFYPGSDTQEPDPTFEALRGAGNVPAYRGVSHVVFKRLNVTEVGTTAINFRFVVTSNGTESVVDWEYAQETATSESALSITHNKYADLMIGCIQRNNDADEPLQTLVAIDPYSHAEVWSGYRVDSLHDGFCNWVESFSFYAFDTSGLAQNQPDEYVALYHRGESYLLPSARFLSVFRADSGVFVGTARVHDAGSQSKPTALYSDNSVFLQIVEPLSIGDTRVFRETISPNMSVTEAEVNPPNGYDFTDSLISLVVKRGITKLGQAPIVLCNVENSSTGRFGFTVFSDFAPSSGATDYTPDYSTVDEFGASDSRMTDGLYDESHDCFWAINGGTGSGSVRISKVSTDGVIESTTDWDSSFSISGTSQRLALDDASGNLWLIVGGSAYRWPTWDISATPESFGSDINQRPIAWHPYTGTLFVGDDGEGIYTQYRLRAVTGGGADLAEVVKDICDAPGANLITADRDADDLAGITVDGFRLTRVMQRRAALQELQTAYLWDFVPRSGVLTAILRGGSSAATLDDDTLGAHVYGTSPGPRLKISRAPEGSLPKMVGVTFIDSSQDYAAGYEHSTRLASEGGTESRVEIGVVLSHEDAAQLADILVHSAHIEAETYEGSAMPSMRSDVVPAGIVTADIDGTEYPMRIDRGSIVDGGIIAFNGVRHDASVYASYMAGGSTRARTRTVSAPGTTQLVILDIPAVREADLTSGLYIAGFSYSADWPGAEFFYSPDGVSFSPVASVSSEVTTGFLTAALADSDSVNDQINSISVNLINGSLSSISHDTMQTDKLLSYAAVGASGRWEIVRFQTASQNADGSWVLTGLQRKLRDTASGSAAHAVGDSFVLLETSKLRRIQIPTSELGSTRYAKAVTLGRLIGQAQARQLTPVGRGLYPFRPACLNADYVTSKWTLTWQRQDKLQARFLQQPQMSESSESYKVDILDLSGAVVRSELATSETFAYGSSKQTEDFGDEVDYLKWRVAQVSAVTGTGPYAYGSSGLFAADYDAMVTGRGSLIEYWPITGSYTSVMTSDSGSHDGTWYPPFTVPEPAITYDGANTFKTTGGGRFDVAGWASTANVKSVVYWFRPVALPSATAVLLCHLYDPGGGNNGWVLYVTSDGRVGLQLYTSGSSVGNIVSTATIAAGSPCTIIPVFGHGSGDDMEIWLNGLLVASGETTGAVALPSAYVMSSGSAYWSGATANLDRTHNKLALYDTQLTPAEIYADALAGFGP